MTITETRPAERAADDSTGEDFDELLAASSLGSPTARRIRELGAQALQERLQRHLRLTQNRTQIAERFTDPNLTLMWDTFAYIGADPCRWNQRSWGCCFAGHALQLSGAVIAITADYGAAVRYHTLPAALREDPELFACSWVRTATYPTCVAGKRFVQVPPAARRLLRLDAGTANALFDGENTMDDLQDIVTIIQARTATRSGVRAGVGRLSRRLAELTRSAVG